MMSRVNTERVRRWPWLLSAALHLAGIAAFLWVFTPARFFSSDGRGTVSLQVEFSGPQGTTTSHHEDEPPPPVENKRSAQTAHHEDEPPPPVENKRHAETAHHEDEPPPPTEEPHRASRMELADGSAAGEPSASTAPALVGIGEGETPAQLLTEGAHRGETPTPPYPRWARERGWTGRVVLELEILATGQIGEVAILEGTGHERLDNYTRDWAKANLRFEPARMAGLPIRTTYRLAFVYELG